MHVGTAAVPARLRAFGVDHARLRLDRPLPIVIGDRLLLLDPGARKVLGGVQVLDPDPVPLRRRGDATRRGLLLANMQAGGDVVAKVAERGAIDLRDLQRLGLVGPGAQPPEQVRAIDGWWVHLPTFGGWCSRLREMVEQQQERDRLTAGVSEGSARALLGSVASRFLDQVVGEAGLERYAGHLRLQGSARDLGAAEAAVVQVEQRLRAAPFDAPEARDLAALGLSVKVLAAAERQGRLMRLPDGVVLLPSAPSLAMRTLAQLPQPFTTSQARQALGTSRRIAIPLLEALDGRGWTRRVDEGHREVVR